MSEEHEELDQELLEEALDRHIPIIKALSISVEDKLPIKDDKKSGQSS